MRRRCKASVRVWRCRPKDTEEYMLALLAKAGVTLAGPPPLTEEEKTWIAAAPDLPDAYDMCSATGWGTRPEAGFPVGEFFGDGQAAADCRGRERAGVEARLRSIRRTARKSGKKPGKVTDSIMRGACYSAAGWSLGSFQRTDPHAADYIDAISADPVSSREYERRVGASLERIRRLSGSDAGCNRSRHPLRFNAATECKVMQPPGTTVCRH